VTPAGESPLASLLRRRIEDGGPIGVDAFMAAALGHPQHGYYATRDPLGRAGDFVTAPEISAAFGELLGLWCVTVWRAMGRPTPLRLVELGAGRGTMLVDALRAASAAAPDFVAASGVHIVETGAVLRDRQRHALAGLASPPSVHWHATMHDVPAGPLLLLANEFFDALPVRQWLRRDGRWYERRVAIAPDDALFAFVPGPPTEDDALGANLPEQPVDGDIFEACPEAEALASTIGARLAAEGGAALIVDYGHARSGYGDTLQAVRGHRSTEPLAEPGAADLSHHVDFARLRAAAERAGATTAGPIAQGLFLGRLGIAARAEAMADAAPSPDRADAILGAIRRLVHPGRMGLLFKAFAIADPALPPLPGFESRRA